MSVNNEAKIKAVLAISLFVISMVTVVSITYEVAYQDGYQDGCAQADRDWADYLDEYWGLYIEYVYREGYGSGYLEGYWDGWMDAREVERVP